MNVSVRPEAEGDAASIHRLHAAAFPRPGGLAGVRGLVKYAAEFAVFG
jgi:hypothetical protein